MTQRIKRITGVAIVSMVFVGLFTGTAIEIGITTAALTWIAAVVIAFVLVGGIKLSVDP